MTILDGSEGAAARGVGDLVVSPASVAQIDHRPRAPHVDSAGLSALLVLRVGLGEAVEGSEVELQQELLLLGAALLAMRSRCLGTFLLGQAFVQHVEVEGVLAAGPRLRDLRGGHRRRRNLLLLVALKLVVREPEVSGLRKRTPPEPAMVSPEEARGVLLRLEAQRRGSLCEQDGISVRRRFPDAEDGWQVNSTSVPLLG
mmetsp:Transcript_108305/g.316825  ORF Transcript_108305/g.316825 Transcript_108305/m.316825 type:complete len:200 (-) Transcript_108305:1394-1993(-)